ncbi:MAG: NADH-quinone oxidoreductase subunit NuoK [Smithellaceae bacterium]|nr:NADH-quinone oxidoreductase subunit NuoK [Smithellaceae bacterium]
MISIPMEHGFTAAAALFALGVAGVLIRRNILFVLLSLEVMLNAAGFAFIVAGARWLQPDGQVAFIFLLAIAAAEVAIGLALILRVYARCGSLDVDCPSKMKGCDVTYLADPYGPLGRISDPGHLWETPVPT